MTDTYTSSEAAVVAVLKVGRTWPQVGHLLGVSEKTARRWSRGRHGMQSDRLTELCQDHSLAVMFEPDVGWFAWVHGEEE